MRLTYLIGKYYLIFFWIFFISASFLELTSNRCGPQANSPTLFDRVTDLLPPEFLGHLSIVINTLMIPLWQLYILITFLIIGRHYWKYRSLTVVKKQIVLNLLSIASIFILFVTITLLAGPPTLCKTF